MDGKISLVARHRHIINPNITNHNAVLLLLSVGVTLTFDFEATSVIII